MTEPIRGMELDPEARKYIRSLGMITASKVLYVANVDDKDVHGEGKHAARVREHAAAEGSGVVAVCSKLESELSALSPEDRKEMLEGLGITGIVLGGLGLGLSQLPERDGAHPKDMLVPSAVTLGASVGAVLLGVVIAELSRGTYQPGAATTFVATR